MTKLIVVTGFTGQQGGSVAEVYSKEPGWRVRGITRNPEKAQAWETKGVEVVKGDLDDPESLEKAFEGANAIFSVTDYWGPFYNPETLKLLKEGQTLGDYCLEVEAQRGKNIVDAAAGVIGLERFIVSALTDVKGQSNGKYTQVYHFDSKAAIVKYIREVDPKLAQKMSIIQIGSYMSNFIEGMQPRKQKDGTFRLSNAGHGKRPQPHILPSRDTGYIVRAAIQAPPGANILGAGTYASYEECLRIWCKLHEVPFGGVDNVPLEVFVSFFGSQKALGQEVGEMLQFMDEYGYAGTDKTVLPGELGVPCPLTSLEEWIKEQDWTHVLNAEPVSY